MDSLNIPDLANKIDNDELAIIDNASELIPVILNDDKINLLIEEFSTQRNSLKSMIVDLEKIKDKIDILFPEKLDKRYIRFFEEKMKSMTSLFGTILDIRKEIMKGLKTEIDLRKVTSNNKNDDDLLQNFNIISMVDKIEKLQIKMDKQKNNRFELRTRGEAHVRIDE